jgi:phytoene dehydrogenase-like protein
MPTLETIIIGGGISGLACARRLHEAGREFLLITDRLGGRMFADELPMRNFGAAYVTRDYRHVLPFVGVGPRLRRRDAYFRDGDRRIMTVATADREFKARNVVIATPAHNTRASPRRCRCNRNCRRWRRSPPISSLDARLWRRPDGNSVLSRRWSGSQGRDGASVPRWESSSRPGPRQLPQEPGLQPRLPPLSCLGIAGLPRA